VWDVDGCEVLAEWSASSDDQSEPAEIRYLLFVNDEPNPTEVVMGITRTVAYGSTTGPNTFVLKAIDGDDRERHGRDRRRQRGRPDARLRPVYVEAGGASLYFSSGPDIYVSRRLQDGSFGPAEAVADLNAAAGDIQPNIRKDGREIVFASNRAHASAFGGQDLSVATRETVDDPWSAPVNLGAAVNTGATRPVPHSPGTRRPLYFGRARGPEGSTDIFVTTRSKLSANQR
jgi:hypothetical protein